MQNLQKTIYQSGPLSFIEIDTNRGKRVTLDMGGDAVLIIPKMRDGRFVLIKQTRDGKSEPTYEFPSGGIKNSELPIDAAKRELLEEVGAVSNLQFIKIVEPLSGLVRFNLHIFMADILEISDKDKNPDEHETLETIYFTKEELFEKIKSLEIVDGYIMLGLGALMLLNLQ